MTTWIFTKYSQDQKLEIIFSYLFSDKKNLEEEAFWNKLSKEEVIKLEKIEKEKIFDFSLLKARVL